MNPTSLRGYQQNVQRFEEFYSLQGEYAAALAAQSAIIRRWLDRLPQPARCADEAEGSSASQHWRTARLSHRRRRELADLLATAHAHAALTAWLRRSLPVISLLEMADFAAPEPAASLTRLDELRARLVRIREAVFLANYGLAKSAAAQGRPEDFDDRMSAACVGLLDAVDRYVPGEQAARFSYFATYWIRYHISRQAQKFNGVVVFPIYQQRIVRKIEQVKRDRQVKGLAEATSQEMCAALEVGPDAFSRQRHRPTILSLEAPGQDGESDGVWEGRLCDPAPLPGSGFEQDDVASRIHEWLRRSFPPATRVMLAYVHDLGPLPAAAADYLDHLREIARERLRFVADR
jgi:DNA-directed RNA polymerase specialized sigma subunit